MNLESMTLGHKDNLVLDWTGIGIDEDFGQEFSSPAWTCRLGGGRR
jgi:hypothetical protein